MFRFLHLADVHLDTTFHCRSDDHRERLRGALRTALERAIDCALDERVHAVLIAGDLFDSDQLSFTTERFLLDQVGRLSRAGVPCYYVTGNHDPGGQRFRASKIAWPQTFHYISDREPVFHEVRDDAGEPVGAVVGAGHVSGRVEENLAALFPPATNGLPHVGLLHTQVVSARSVDAHDRYAPCAVEDLQRPAYQYWALGHIHLRQQVCRESNAWYAGNLQGRTPRETGAKGGLLVTLDGHAAPEVVFRPFAPVQWAELRLDALDDVHTLADLASLARGAFEEHAAEHGGAEDWFLRLRLSGSCPMADDLRSEGQRTELEEELRHVLDVADVEVRLDRVALPVDVDAYRGEPSVLGELLHLIERAGDDPALLRDLACGELAGAEGADGREAYLRHLLDGLDREAVARMLDES